MPETILGARIRERRCQMGVTQAEMARRIGISASYLSLIEGNRRRIAGTLLQRTAAELGLGLDDLDGAGERRLVKELAEIARTPALEQLGAAAAESGEFVGRHPGWARALASLARSEQAAQTRVRALAERLNHDPFLGETVHRMLTRIAAVRSAAEILDDFPDISSEERRRFDGIVLAEARALSEVGEALARYFDGSETGDLVLTPQDEVDAFFAAHRNHFPRIEDRAERLAPKVAGADRADRAEAAMELAKARLGEAIAAAIDGADEIRTAAGEARAARALTSYAVGAILLPLRAFSESARELRYDCELLARRFGADVSDVFRRLASLPPESPHPRFGHMRANASGSLLELLAIDGLTAPRHAPPCPLWILFGAQRTPDRLLRQRVRFISGDEFIFVASARNVGDPGFAAPQHFLTDMLVLPRGEADATVYGDGADLPPEEVGTACRLCARRACRHRVDDPFLG